MVAMAKNDKDVMAGVVCPACYKKLIAASIVGGGFDKRYQSCVRTYFGWCFECSHGYEVIQFEKDGNWLIHKYMDYTINAQTHHSRPSGKWQVLCSLPEPPLVMTGPGGDYVKPMNIKPTKLDVEIEKTLRSIIEIFQKTSNALVELLAIAKKDRGGN